MAGPLCSPSENNLPPFVDADGVRSGRAALEWFTLDARKRGKVGELLSGIHWHELAQSDVRDSCETLVAFGLEQFVGNRHSLGVDVMLGVGAEALK